MVIEVTTPLLIPQILELAKNLPEAPVDKLRGMLVEGLSSKNARIYVEKKDDDVRGYMFATIENFNGEDAVFIQSCFVDTTAPQACHELLNKIKLWGEGRGLRTMYFWAYRDPKAFARKYKFELYGHILKRRII